MKLTTVISSLAFAGFASAVERTAAIYVQPVLSSAPAPVLLAEVTYDSYLPLEASIASFEFPELDSFGDAKNLRVGVYSPYTKSWESSTSVASVQNFGKGYSPHVILSVDQSGDVLGAALKGVRIDAGQTRDFGPKAVVRVTEKGEQVALNKPIKLSPEGKSKVEEQEKTFLQKYVFIFVRELPVDANKTQVLVGDRSRRGAYRHHWRWWRWEMIGFYICRIKFLITMLRIHTKDYELLHVRFTNLPRFVTVMVRNHHVLLERST